MTSHPALACSLQRACNRHLGCTAESQSAYLLHGFTRRLSASGRCTACIIIPLCIWLPTDIDGHLGQTHCTLFPMPVSPLSKHTTCKWAYICT